MILAGLLDRDLTDLGFSLTEDEDFIEILLKGARIGRGIVYSSTSAWLTRDRINRRVRKVVADLSIQREVEL